MPLDETEMGKYDLEGIVPSLAYRYENPPYAAALVVQRTVPRLTARTVSCFRVSPEGLAAHDELALPRRGGPRAAGGAGVAPRHPRGPEDPRPGRHEAEGVVCEPAKPGDTVRRWNVLLEEATSGEVRLAVDFQQPLPWKEGKVGDYPLPVVQAAGVAYQSGLVSVEGSAELDVQVHADARRVDVGELTKEAEYRPGRHLRGVFSLVGAKKPVTIDVDPPPRLSALRGRRPAGAILLTLLSADGASQTRGALHAPHQGPLPGSQVAPGRRTLVGAAPRAQAARPTAPCR